MSRSICELPGDGSGGAGGATSTGGLIELGGDQIACTDNNDPSVWSSRTTAFSSCENDHDYSFSVLGQARTKEGLGDGAIGFRCALDPLSSRAVWIVKADWSLVTPASTRCAGRDPVRQGAGVDCLDAVCY
ncbi:MAG TPA: hypothetical protein VMT03_02385 [Polyangia bacterium]|nr:hypothetical protein [Polyangia bacterium]